MAFRSFLFALSLSLFATVPLIPSLDGETAQTPIRPVAAPETRPYTDGTIWVLEFLRTKEGTADRLLERLAFDWRSLLEQARGEGLIVSYKVFHGMPGHQRDWDIMTLIEVRNMAAFDGFNQRLGDIAANPVGPRRAGSADLADLRDIVGTRMVREILLRAPR